ncbi:hypothetical protein DOY81_015116, partial [Sarcophaga bullata]
SNALDKSKDSGESDAGDTRLYRRKIRDRSNVLDISEEIFVSTFRVTKEIFKNLLDEISPKLKIAYRRTHIPAITKLATFLMFLATGDYQDSIKNEYVSTISKPMVSKIIAEFLIIFETHLSPKWIVLDKSLDEENKAKESFYRTGGIPGIVGCIDGTHVRIKAPGSETNHLYYKRKGYYSINVMLICDQDMVITFVDASQPGTYQDSFIWENSAAHDYFKTNYLNGKMNTWLLGNSGYKLQPYLMTPYRNPSNEQEQKYNEKHCKILNIIERCKVMLKNRFRCILGPRELLYTPEKVTQIITACCVLHNICIFYKSNWTPDENSELLNCNEYDMNDDVNDDDDDEIDSEETAESKSIRDEISRYNIY